MPEKMKFLWSSVRPVVYDAWFVTLVGGLAVMVIWGYLKRLKNNFKSKKQLREKVVEPPKTPLPEPLANLVRLAKVFGKDRVFLEWFLKREKQRVDEKTKAKQEELMTTAKEAAAKPTWRPTVNFNHPRLRAMMRPETHHRTADDFIRETEEAQKHKQ